MSFSLANPAKPTIEKDPDAVLDYSFDWTDWMDGDDTITGVETLPAGTLVVDTEIVTSRLADPVAVPPVVALHLTTAIVRGGTVGKTESVTFRITTAEGRIDDRTMFFKVLER